MLGIGETELVILYVFLPLACAAPAYRIAKKKGYGQLAAAAAVAITIALVFVNPFLGIVPLVFFVLAPKRM